MEAPDDLQKNTVTQQATQQNSEEIKPTRHRCNKPRHYRNQCRQLKREKDQTRNNTNSSTIATIIKVMVKQTLTPTTKFPTKPIQTIHIIKKREHLDLSTHPLRPVVKLSTPQRSVSLEPMQRTDRLPGGTKPSSTEKCSKQLSWECSCCSPNFKLETPCLHSGAACDRPELIVLPKLPPITEVGWQQSLETSTNKGKLKNTSNESILYYTQEKTTVASEKSPNKRIQPQNYVVTTEHLPKFQTGNEPVPFFNCSKYCPTDISITEQHVTTTLTGHTTIPHLTTTTPLIEEGLMRDEQKSEVYRPLTSTIVLKRKEMLYVPLELENNLTVDALVESGVIVTAIAQNDLDTIKEKNPNNFLKNDDAPSFQTQVANG